MKDRTLVSFGWALKSILRQKENFDVLEGFLTDLLGEEIEVEALLESESSQDDKYDRVALKAKDSLDREIIIEMQFNPEPDYLERIYYGVSKSIADEMKSGYRYGQAKKIISISFIYCQSLYKSYVVKGSTQFEDLSGNNKQVDIAKVKNIFADYYFIQPENFDGKVETKLDEWIYFFKYSEIKGDIAVTNVGSLINKLDKLKMSDEECEKYEDYQYRTIETMKIEEDQRISEILAKYELNYDDFIALANANKIIYPYNAGGALSVRHNGEDYVKLMEKPSFHTINDYIYDNYL